MTPSSILEALRDSKPQSLIGLPTSFGIYALWDHSGEIRYIGCTPKRTKGFNIRIGNKHVSGTEGMSHKFSHAYCVGRMWRYQSRLHPLGSGTAERPEDAAISKRVRNIFIREYCRATLLEIPEQHGSEYSFHLTSLESAVKALAPSTMKRWDGKRFCAEAEPALLVDEILRRYPDMRNACDRQAALFCEYQTEHSCLASDRQNYPHLNHHAQVGAN